MKLEVLTVEGKAPRRETPILFVHGIYSSAQIWQPYFQPYFAERGWTTHAMSLRGHGASDGLERIKSTRLRDYVDDVTRIAGGFDTPPVLVGTSMGGVLVQHYLKNHKVPAAVLIGSGPPHGMIPSVWSMMARNPFLASEMSLMAFVGPQFSSIATARRALFRADTPDDYIRQHYLEPNPEAPLAMLDVLAFDLPPAWPRRDVPVLVLGAGEDAFVTPQAVRQTARAFGTEAVVFPGMPHAMMLDPEWETVARCIADWLDTALPGRDAA